MTLRTIPPNEYEVREGAWAIVKASRDLNASGHEKAVAWARAWLGLEDRGRSVVIREGEERD